MSCASLLGYKACSPASSLVIDNNGYFDSCRATSVGAHPAAESDPVQPRQVDSQQFGHQSTNSSFSCSCLMLLSHSKYLHRVSYSSASLVRRRSSPRLPQDFRKMDTLRQKMSSLTPFAKKHKVTIVGSGNWWVHLLLAGSKITHRAGVQQSPKLWPRILLLTPKFSRTTSRCGCTRKKSRSQSHHSTMIPPLISVPNPRSSPTSSIISTRTSNTSLVFLCPRM